MDRNKYQKPSYLMAKDQTIVILSRANLKTCRVNLVNEMSEDTSVESLTDDQRIPVYLRIKGGFEHMDLYEIKEDTLICKVPEESSSFRNLKPGDVMTRTYKFSRIFGPNSSQIEIFNGIVKPKILDFINGKNGTLFTYGTTGSGKTFTIVGTSVEPGIIPRALEYIFKTIPKLPSHPEIMPLPNGDVLVLKEEQMILEEHRKNDILKIIHNDRSMHVKTYRQMQQRLSSEPVAEIEDYSNVSISIWVSFAEIYNENVYDLLQPLPKNKIRPKLKLCHSAGQTYIKNLSSVCVRDGLEAYQIHQYGIQNLNYAATALNSHSSRSHAIFTIKLVQTSKIDGGRRISCLKFCDLAGSERSKKTQNIGDRLKESNSINRSLLALGRCIQGVRTAQQSKENLLIPFRESKLTQLFQYALLGQENIAMIVNLNPLRSMFEESHHALNFSAVTKEITIEQKPVVTIQTQHKEDTREIEELKKAISDLYNENANLRAMQETEVLEEKRQIADMYTKYIKQLKERYDNDRKLALDNQKEYYEAQVERLKQLVKEAEVVNISSSSDENSFSKTFFEEENQELQQKCEKLEKDKQELQAINTSLLMEKEAMLREIEKLKRKTRNEEMNEQKLLKQVNYERIISEMKKNFQELEQENQIYKAEIKRLTLLNIKLNDECDELNLISFGGSGQTNDSDSETVENEFFK